MSWNSLPRAIRDRLPRIVRRLMTWKTRLEPLTFERRDRLRESRDNHSGGSVLCSCPQCRHARRERDEHAQREDPPGGWKKTPR